MELTIEQQLQFHSLHSYLDSRSHDRPVSMLGLMNNCFPQATISFVRARDRSDGFSEVLSAAFTEREALAALEKEQAQNSSSKDYELRTLKPDDLLRESLSFLPQWPMKSFEVSAIQSYLKIALERLETCHDIGLVPPLQVVMYVNQ